MINRTLAFITFICVLCIVVTACTDDTKHTTVADSTTIDMTSKIDSTDFTNQFWSAVDKGIKFAQKDGGYGLLKDLDFDGIPELMLITGGAFKCNYEIYNLSGDVPVFIGTITTSDNGINENKLTIPELTLYQDPKTKDRFYVAEWDYGMDSRGYANSYMYQIKGCSLSATKLSECEFDFAGDDDLYISKNIVNGENTTPIGKVAYNDMKSYSDGLCDYLSKYEKIEVINLDECWVNDDLDLSKKAHQQAEKLLSEVSNETQMKYQKTTSNYISVDGINYSKSIEKWGRDHAEYINYIPEVPLPLLEISQFTNLKELALFLKDDKSFDLSVIENLPELRSLYISSDNLIDVSSFTDLKNLKSLYLASKELELSSLNKLQSLETLTIYCSNDTDISKISGLANLKKLILIGDTVSDLSAINDLPSLVSISITNGSSINIDSLQQFTGLQELNISSTPLKDLSLLNKLKSLRVVDVFSSDGSINYIKPLYDLPNLEAIRYNCYLTDEQLNALRTNLPDCALIWVP